MSSDQLDQRSQQLAYTERNPDGETTIIFIHGAFSSGSEWDMVTLSIPPTYHILLPDLPSHGRSRAITPFSVPIASQHLADLIRDKAKGGAAHVVGLSLGAHIAIDLATTHPEVVRTVFVSGYEVYPRTWFSPYVPYALWLMTRVESAVPRALTRWLMDGADIQRADRAVVTLPLCRQIVGQLFSDGETQEWPSAPWKARTLVVAAGKAGILPTSDHPDDARKLAEIGKQGNPKTVAVTHPKARHPWNRQMPEIFAEAVRAWIEDEDVGVEFPRL